MLSGGILAGASLAGIGFISSGGVLSGGAVIIGGVVTLQDGAQIAGGLALDGGTAVIAGSVTMDEVVQLAGHGEDLVLGNVRGFDAMISGFGAGNVIDLVGIPYALGETVDYAQTGSNTGTLTVAGDMGAVHINLAGNYSNASFMAFATANGDTRLQFG